jgi:hypothetical protein
LGQVDEVYTNARGDSPNGYRLSTVSSTSVLFEAKHRSWLLAVVATSACETHTYSSIVISAQFQYVSPQAAIVVPQDLSSTQVAAYVRDGDGFDRYPSSGTVSGTLDGKLVISDVLDGPFLLQVVTAGENVWFAYADHSVTWDDDVIGRADAVAATAAQTSLTITADGMAPWKPQDLLIADSWSNGTENDDVGADLLPPVAGGATSFASTLNWNDPAAFSFGPSARPYLLDASAGDSLVLSHLTEAESPNMRESSYLLTDVMTLSGITQTDGAAQSVSGTFSQVPLSTVMSGSIDLDALASERAPGSTPDGWFFFVITGPGLPSDILMGPNLMEVNGSETSGVVQLNESFGDPFDPTWPVFGSSTFMAHRSISIPSVTEPLMFEEGLGETLPLTDIGTDITPNASFLNVITINGVPLEDNFLAWDGTSPLTIAVDDDVDGFTAQILQFTRPGDVFTSVAAISAMGSSITVPSIVFSNDSYYTLSIHTWTAMPNGGGCGATTQTGKIRIAPESQSICGDGVVDPSRGERCDGGSGCSSSCQ